MKSNVSKEILLSMDKGLKGDFEKIRGIHYNPNVKGGDYEKIVNKFLEAYFSGKYTLYMRCSLLDTELKIHDVFSPAENEFDVVATHKRITPQIVIDRNGSVTVPYDATAFIVEVKQTLTITNLSKDLHKYKKLGKVNFSDMGPIISGNFTVEHPFKVLFYYEGNLTEKMIDKLIKSRKHWDILISFKPDILIASGELPLTKKLTKAEPIAIYNQYCLAVMLYYLPATLPTPLGGNTANLIFNLLKVGLEIG